MSRVLIVNASAPAYNLGAEKIAAWHRAQGASVEITNRVRPLFVRDYDALAISAVFSWHVPALIEGVRVWQAFGCGPIEVGGPGTFGLREYVTRETGLTPRATPDDRFDRQPGTYKAVFWSRGCPAYNCTLGYPKNGAAPICIVPEMEGSRFTLNTDATPAPMILDNNLSALPRRHQENIVERTLAAGFKRVDCNSGFEPRSFRPETAELWSRLPLVAWRFAYDEIAERKAVMRVIEILDGIGVKRRDLHIYCIAGNEPVEACEQRVMDIRAWKALPVVQKRTPLDYMGGPLPVLHDWTERKLADFKRWGNRASHSIPWKKYDPRLNHSGVKFKEALT